ASRASSSRFSRSARTPCSCARAASRSAGAPAGRLRIWPDSAVPEVRVRLAIRVEAAILKAWLRIASVLLRSSVALGAGGHLPGERVELRQRGQELVERAGHE